MEGGRGYRVNIMARGGRPQGEVGNTVTASCLEGSVKVYDDDGNQCTWLTQTFSPEQS